MFECPELRKETIFCLSWHHVSNRPNFASYRDLMDCALTLWIVKIKLWGRAKEFRLDLSWNRPRESNFLNVDWNSSFLPGSLSLRSLCWGRCHVCEYSSWTISALQGPPSHNGAIKSTLCDLILDWVGRMKLMFGKAHNWISGQGSANASIPSGAFAFFIEKNRGKVCSLRLTNPPLVWLNAHLPVYIRTYCCVAWPD